MKQDPAFQSSLVVEFLLKRDFRDDAVLDNVTGLTIDAKPLNNGLSETRR